MKLLLNVIIVITAEGVIDRVSGVLSLYLSKITYG